MKDSYYVKINGVNPLYLIIHKVDGHFEKKKMELNTYFLILQTKTEKY